MITWSVTARPVKHADAFEAMGGPALIAAYNAMVKEAEAAGLAGYREVARFADKQSAVKRCVALQASLRAHAQGQVAANRQEGTYDEMKTAGGLRSDPVPAFEAPATELAAQVTRQEVTDPVNEQPPVVVDITTAAETEEAEMAKRSKTERTVSKARGGGKRTEGQMTLKEQMEYFNSLVPKALKKGLKVKHHTSTFESFEKGLVQIKKLEKAIEAA